MQWFLLRIHDRLPNSLAFPGAGEAALITAHAPAFLLERALSRRAASAR